MTLFMQQKSTEEQKCYQVACKDISKEQMNYNQKGVERDFVIVKDSSKTLPHIDILFVNIFYTPISIMTLGEITVYQKNGTHVIAFVGNPMC